MLAPSGASAFELRKYSGHLSPSYGWKRTIEIHDGEDGESCQIRNNAVRIFLQCANSRIELDLRSQICEMQNALLLDGHCVEFPKQIISTEIVNAFSQTIKTSVDPVMEQIYGSETAECDIILSNGMILQKDSKMLALEENDFIYQSEDKILSVFIPDGMKSRCSPRIG